MKNIVLMLALVFSGASVGSEITVDYDDNGGLYLPCIYTKIGTLAAQLGSNLQPVYVRGAVGCKFYHAYYVWDNEELIIFDIRFRGSLLVHIPSEE